MHWNYKPVVARTPNLVLRSVLKSVVAVTAILSAGCAIMHSTQLGEIDSRVVSKGRKFQILVSETGYNLDEAAGILKAGTQHQQTRSDIGKAQAIIGLFQMGPRTGNQVLTDAYADSLFDLLRKECPKGRISGLMSVRETAKYPVISGEIVKLTGYCLEEGA